MVAMGDRVPWQMPLGQKSGDFHRFLGEVEIFEMTNWIIWMIWMILDVFLEMKLVRSLEFEVLGDVLEMFR